MLFKYKHIKHPLDKFHVYIRHLVLDVWCNASQPFSTDLLMPSFSALVNAMPNNYLLNPIQEIYNDLKRKPKSFKRLLHDGFRKNNNIEALCSGSYSPIQYAAIKVVDKDFSNKLYKFFVNAYDLLDDSRVNASLGGINKHYKEFFKKGVNKTVCPFCGILPMLNSENAKREAYDHYFPKEIYPFNSVNFDNLVPMCHTCNSKYKTRKDPINLRYGGPRRNVFFPFITSTSTNIDIEFTFNTTDVENLTSADIDILITPDNSNNEVDRWKEIFGIEERYKAVCCEEAAYKGWLEEYQTMTQMGTVISFNDYLAAKSTNKHLNKKFLEVAYLTACRNATVI